MRSKEIFRGCLIGGATGDALGYAVEFMEDADIFRKYGENGITEYDLYKGTAQISDDTQMTMFTATGLLLGTTRGMLRGIMGAYEDYIRHSYKDWYRTQTEQYPLPEEYHYSWLVNVPELFSRRAPGNTCMSALGSNENGSVKHPINRSKGCGGVMRVAPIGLYFAEKSMPIEKSDMIGAEAAAITHGHELGWLPAAVLVHIIRHLVENEGESILAAVQDARFTLPDVYPEAEKIDVLQALLQKAIDLSKSELDDLDAIRQLGQGWVGEEALAIAVYCALRHPGSFEDAIIAAVNHSGDSDSTGAIAGNIMGAALGLKAIPEKYLERLELRDVILDLADDLFNDCQMEEYGDYEDPVWLAKYVDMNYQPKHQGERNL
jgi:ADP-ribosylglycohydrolase